MFEQYRQINKIYGVQIHSGSGGDVRISICEINIVKDQLSFGIKLTGITGIPELKAKLPEKALIALVLTGKGVLNKQLDHDEAVNSGNFSLILPNANFEYFYLQQLVSAGKSFVSVMRKAEVNRWMEEFGQLKMQLLSVSFGVYAVQQILDQLNVYEQQLIFDGHIIRFDEQRQIVEVKAETNAHAPFIIKAEQEELHEELLLAYAAAFQLSLYPRLQPVQADIPVLKDTLEDKLQVKKLKFQAAVIIFIAFIALLINFLIYTSMIAENEKLSIQLSRSNKSTVDREAVSKSIDNQEQILQNLGWEGQLNKAAFVNELAAMLPSEVKWKEIQINPPDAKLLKIQKVSVFLKKRIKITGTSANVLPVNEWIARIKTREWVKAVQLENYAFSAEANTGQFNVLIDYK